MDYAGIATENWSNPESVPIDSAKLVFATEPEPTNASTVDPSHIIHLIRQILPTGIPAAPVPRPDFVEGDLLGKNGSVPETLQIVEGGIPYKNEVMQPGQGVGRSSTKDENVTNVTSTGSPPESDSIHVPVVDKKYNYQLRVEELIHENSNHFEGKQNYVEENGNLTKQNDSVFEQNGSHIQEITRCVSKTGKEGVRVVEEHGHISNDIGDRCPTNDVELLETGGTSTIPLKSEGITADRILNVEEVEAFERQVEHDDHQRAGGGDDDTREEAGCILWDLAATESHAEFLVEHHLLDVLLAILHGPHSDRMREICLGIFGNLACHPGPVRTMVATAGLLSTVVQQLFTEHIPSLTETCRFLSAGLHSEGTLELVESIKPDHVLERILWMAANTLNSQLMEKCTELILVMVDTRRDAAFVLLPSLLRLGLPGLLTDLIGCELTAIQEGTSSCGDAVLDIVLQIAEAISVSDDSASQLTTSDKLFCLSCQVIRMSARDEIGPSGITAIVLIANLLTEEAGFIQQVLHDTTFFERLLALGPCAGDDPGARNALWSIVGRICSTLFSTDLGDVHSGIIAVLADGCSLLLDDLELHEEEDVKDDEGRALEGHNALASTSRGLHAKLATVVTMMHVMEQWASLHSGRTTQDMPLFRSVRHARELLKKHIETTSGLAGGELDEIKDIILDLPASTAKS